MSISNSAAATKPIKGDKSSETPTSRAFTQLTPSPKCDPALSIALAKPTPMIEPIRVCELDAGNPKYQVPRFHRIAESSREKTIANPAADPTLSINSTGRSASTPKATAPLEVRTPIRFQRPDHTTATVGRRELV
jgi:hypothetical protein